MEKQSLYLIAFFSHSDDDLASTSSGTEMPKLKVKQSKDKKVSSWPGLPDHLWDPGLEYKRYPYVICLNIFYITCLNI